MALVTVTSPRKSQSLSIQNNINHLRDASFSSYIKGAEETFVLKFSESGQNFSTLISHSHENLYLGRDKVEDEEIGVFDAKKYFNEASPKVAPKTQHEKIEEPAKTKSHPRTPSVHSETSWNSRSALLQTATTNPPARKENKAHGKSFFASLGCSCTCSDKNSVDINEHVTVGVSQAKTVHKEPDLDSGFVKIDEMGRGLNREDCFSFPVLDSKKESLAARLKLEEEEIKNRKSLEVFGSPILEKGQRTLSLERRLTMFNWDSTPRIEEETNDTDSDASSDLFEIESLAISGSPLDCVTPTTCYAPSEASIEWSVVTASMADFSIMSDFDEPRVSAANKTIFTSNKSPPNKEIQKRRPSLLVCNSQKAVRIVGDAHRTSEKASDDLRRRHRSDSSASMTRFRAENNLTGFDSRIGRHGSAACSMSRAHSATASQLLYIE